MADKLVNMDTRPATADGTRGRLRDLGDGTFAEVVSLPVSNAVLWPANTAFDARSYSEIKFQFSAGSVAVTSSLDDAAMPYEAQPVLDKNYSPQAVASIPAIYSVPGRQWLKFSAPVYVIGGN